MQGTALIGATLWLLGGMASARELSWELDPLTQVQSSPDDWLGPLAPAPPVKGIRVIPRASAASLKVAFLGDQGTSSDAEAVLRLVKLEGAGLLVHLGDFAYGNNPDPWDRLLSRILGPSFPVLGAIGNHDMKARQKFQQKLAARLANAGGVTCAGELGMLSSCRSPSVFFVLLGYRTAGSDMGNSFIREEMARSQSPWKVCAWHVPEPAMQVGGKKDRVGWGIYEECRAAGAIIATAHEHSYSRTHLMEDFENQRVAATSNTLRLSKGRSFAFVSGLGGRPIRRQERGGPWWAAIYTKSQKAKHGALFCTFGDGSAPERAECYFKDVAGNIIDQFDLISELASSRQ